MQKASLFQGVDILSLAISNVCNLMLDLENYNREIGRIHRFTSRAKPALTDNRAKPHNFIYTCGGNGLYYTDNQECKYFPEYSACLKILISQGCLPNCNWLLSETTWCFCFETELRMRREAVCFLSPHKFGQTKEQSGYARRTHVDSWTASGGARYDYFSGRAIEQQHGAITNIFFAYPLTPPLQF